MSPFLGYSIYTDISASVTENLRLDKKILYDLINQYAAARGLGQQDNLP